jgi:hypothetical protein
LKQQQQQAGITGIGELSAGNEQSALSSLGLSNSAISDWSAANTSAWGPALAITGDIASAAGSYAQGAAKG